VPAVDDSNDGTRNASRLHKLVRQSEVLGSLDLYTRLDNPTTRIPVGDPSRTDAALESFRRGLGAALSAPSRLYGWQVQTMFKEMVAALGGVVLLKDEDAGDCYFSGELVKVPDYLVTTSVAHHVLIEVKNARSKRAFGDFSLSLRELDGLRRYTELSGRAELKLAIYWSNQNAWTLIDPGRMTTSQSRATVSFGDALRYNEMARLGDFMIATMPPLTFTIFADSARPNSINRRGEAQFTIGRTELRCNGQILEDKTEKRLAWYFLLYGPWPSSNQAEVADGRLISVTFEAAPEEPVAGQEFQFIGSMSELFSSYFNAATLGDDSGVRALRTTSQPGSLGELLPETHKSKRLPLWRFRLKPAD